MQWVFWKAYQIITNAQSYTAKITVMKRQKQTLTPHRNIWIIISICLTKAFVGNPNNCLSRQKAMYICQICSSKGRCCWKWRRAIKGEQGKTTNPPPPSSHSPMYIFVVGGLSVHECTPHKWRVHGESPWIERTTIQYCHYLSCKLQTPTRGQQRDTENELCCCLVAV